MNYRLFGEQTELTVCNMSFSGEILSSFPEYIDAALRVKMACALTNAQCGYLDIDKQERIVEACQNLRNPCYRNQFPVDVFHGGGGIGINMNINEVIASAAGDDIHPVNDVNMSQSTSDVCHTSLRLSVFYLLNELDEVLNNLIRTLETKAKLYKNISTIARTCWQDGMKVSASALFEGTQYALIRQRKK